MPNTFTLINAVTVGSGGSSTIDFTSIPSTYTDLALKISVRNTGTGNIIDGYLRFNGSTSGYGRSRMIQGNGASASSVNQIDSTYSYWQVEHPGTSTTANTFGSIDLYIPNYTSTTTAKSISGDQVTENNGTTAYGFLSVGLWSPGTQVAVNQITLYSGTGSFAQNSTAYLYGIVKS